MLNRLTESLKKQFPDRIIAVYVFGSRVRGDHGEWSDFDVLVIVKDKTPEIETEIISLFVDEEIQSGIPFSVVIKDIKAFKMEKKFNTPFYENITKEGVLLWLFVNPTSNF
ncbi:MAG: nucleotidyltransferase domain-containing protein [Thermodesulfovibrionales bacterium]